MTGLSNMKFYLGAMGWTTLRSEFDDQNMPVLEADFDDVKFVCTCFFCLFSWHFFPDSTMVKHHETTIWGICFSNKQTGKSRRCLKRGGTCGSQTLCTKNPLLLTEFCCCKLWQVVGFDNYTTWIQVFYVNDFLGLFSYSRTPEWTKYSQTYLLELLFISTRNPCKRRSNLMFEPAAFLEKMIQMDVSISYFFFTLICNMTFFRKEWFHHCCA